MKYFIAILLSLSLYAPDVAKLVAYADYVVDVATNTKVNICNCEPILEKNKTADHTDHHVVVKADWIYLVTQVVSVVSYHTSPAKVHCVYTEADLSQFSNTIFQPPKV